MNNSKKALLTFLFSMTLHGQALANEKESTVEQEVAGDAPLANDEQQEASKPTNTNESSNGGEEDDVSEEIAETDFGLNFAPAILFLHYPKDKVSRAIVRDGVVRVTKSSDTEIRIGLEAHITYGWNWVWMESKRRSSRVGLGPFLALIFNGDSIPIGGYGVVGSLTKWSDEESATPMGLNIGLGHFIDNTFAALPSRYVDGKVPPPEDSTKEGQVIELKSETQHGFMVMISASLGF